MKNHRFGGRFDQYLKNAQTVFSHLGLKSFPLNSSIDPCKKILQRANSSCRNRGSKVIFSLQYYALSMDRYVTSRCSSFLKISVITIICHGDYSSKLILKSIDVFGCFSLFTPMCRYKFRVVRKFKGN